VAPEPQPPPSSEGRPRAAWSRQRPAPRRVARPCLGSRWRRGGPRQDALLPGQMASCPRKRHVPHERAQLEAAPPPRTRLKPRGSGLGRERARGGPAARAAADGTGLAGTAAILPVAPAGTEAGARRDAGASPHARSDRGKSRGLGRATPLVRKLLKVHCAPRSASRACIPRSLSTQDRCPKAQMLPMRREGQGG